jgi:hypothetical protein
VEEDPTSRSRISGKRPSSTGEGEGRQGDVEQEELQREDGRKATENAPPEKRVKVGRGEHEDEAGEKEVTK